MELLFRHRPKFDEAAEEQEQRLTIYRRMPDRVSGASTRTVSRDSFDTSPAFLGTLMSVYGKQRTGEWEPVMGGGNVMNMLAFIRLCTVRLLLLACLQGCVSLSSNQEAHSEPNPDPWEGMNRRVDKFNEAADRIITKPAARVYRKIIPGPIRYSLGRVYANLLDVNDAVNNLLQGKSRESLSDLTRVAINTTLGIGGLFDPASRMGLQNHNEDFGQTLATWGVPPGPYIVTPFLGSGSLRDTLTRPVDGLLDPLVYLHPARHRYITYGARLVHQRSQLLGVEKTIFGDRYLFLRDAYLQRRAYLVKDGEVEDLFDDDF